MFQALREAIDPRQSPALYLSSSAVDRLCFDGSWRLTYTPGMACLRRAAFTFGGALLASHVYRAEREMVLKRNARKDDEAWILTHTLISRETRVLDHVLTLRVMLACSVREERALRMSKRDTVDDFVNRLRSQNAGSQAIARMIDRRRSLDRFEIARQDSGCWRTKTLFWTKITNEPLPRVMC